MGRRKGKMKSRPKRPKGKRNNNPTAADSSSSSAPPPPWIELPRDVTVNILSRLSPEEILDKAEKVCSTWRSVCAEPSLWRVIHMKSTSTPYEFGRAQILCRRAVDRSLGQLIDICIQDFGNDDLLRYISERSSHLKILTLESCGDISSGGLTTALTKLSGLEELHLFFSPVISDLEIETIGVSCPMLKSFTFNQHVFGFPLGHMDDTIPLSIAKNMPNLRCLSLVGNCFSNQGLLAILDGCLNLELLDLLGCFCVNIECDIGRRCSEQVKKLRRPFDSTSGCEWDARVYDVDGGDDCSDDYFFGDVNLDDGDGVFYDLEGFNGFY